MDQFSENPVGDIEDAAGVGEKLTGRENALYRQLRNEERKLSHRMQVADQLRQTALSTGDDQLMQAAERLEANALDHYTSRLAKITEFQQRFSLPEFGDLTTPVTTTPVTTPQ
jgi:hypothetical protein